MAEPRYRYLQTRTVRGVLVLTPTPARLEGDEMAQQVTDDILAAVAHAGAKRVVVNLEHVAYLTSANFRPLLALRRTLQPDGGRVMLCNLTTTLFEIFETTKMVSSHGSTTSGALFSTRPDVDAAVDALLTDQEGAAAKA